MKRLVSILIVSLFVLSFAAKAMAGLVLADGQDPLPPEVELGVVLSE